MISLLPADTYTVVNKNIITEEDRKNIISLYYTLLRDLRLMDVVSSDLHIII